MGYRGRTFGPDLEDKLARLRAEASGFQDEPEIPGTRGLRVFPVERVLAKADHEKYGQGQMSLW